MSALGGQGPADHRPSPFVGVRKPGKPLLDNGDKGVLLIMAVIMTPVITAAALIVSFAS